MSFDSLARHYDWLEALTAGPRLERVRAAGLDALAGRRRILSMGEGHGRFAAACVARFPEVELTCVDTSERMLARARRRLAARAASGSESRVRWECADVLHWSSAEKFDAVVTCFFLDCFPPKILAQVIARLAAAMARDAVWLNVDFAVPERGWRRQRALAIHRLMYAFFRVATRLPARRWTTPDALLAAQGFRLERRHEAEWGLLRSDVWRR